MEYSIDIDELIKRPIIRKDHPHEFICKMTDDEIVKFHQEIEENLKDQGIPQQFPEWISAMIAAYIDRGILYDVIKMGKDRIIFGR